MYDNLLEEIGLTKSEISVYFALLDLGSSTTGPIIKRAGIASGKAYLILDKLILKGLVTYVIKSGRKYYQAKDPERLLEYLKEKEEDLKKKEEQLVKILPSFKMKYQKIKDQQRAEVYEGLKGFQTMYIFVLDEMKSGDCIYVMGVPKKANERLESFLLWWNKERVRRGIKMRIIYNHDCREFGGKREKMKLTEVRYMKPEMETPTWIDIFGDYVATMNVHGTPVCFLIRDKESAETYRKYFGVLWKTAKP